MQLQRHVSILTLALAAALPLALPAGHYRLAEDGLAIPADAAAMSWALGAYAYDRYKPRSRAPAHLHLPASDAAQRGLLRGAVGHRNTVARHAGEDLVEGRVVVELPAEGGDILGRPALQQEPALVIVEPEPGDIGQRVVVVHADRIAAEAAPVGELLRLDDEVAQVRVAEDVRHGPASNRIPGSRAPVR